VKPPRVRSPIRALPGHAHWLPTEPGWEAVADGIADWLDRQFD